MRTELRKRFIAVLLGSMLVACAATGNRSDETGVFDTRDGSLEIAPRDFTLVLRDHARPSIEYSAQWAGVDGTVHDVTTSTTFRLANTLLGDFDGARFVPSGLLGKTTVQAMAYGQVAETRLSVVEEKIWITTGVPSNAPDLFGGQEDPTRSPTWVYPPDGVLIPPNMGTMEIHFLPGVGNELFELHLASAGNTARIYFRCTPVSMGCVFKLSGETWRFIAESGRKAESVKATLKATDSMGMGVGTSALREVLVAPEDVNGGIYYWNAGTVSILRYEFGVSGQYPEKYMGAAEAGASQCVGCHHLSRDGSRIAIGLDMPAPAVLEVYDTRQMTSYFRQGSSLSGGGANFVSFFPDNQRIATSNGLWIDVRDANTGALLIDKLVPNGTMPDISPDGEKMVYARSLTPSACTGAFCSATGVTQASIDELRFENGGWAEPRILVPSDGANHFYPSFSPDGQFVMYNRSLVQDSFEAKMAEIWITADTVGAKPVRLVRACQGVDVWPKWAPRTYSWKGGSLMWFTFSSRRAYGLYTNGTTAPQLWMAAFDVNRANAGEDPSFSAFWLPFQDLESGNHIAQWVMGVARRSCVKNAECEGSESCINGVCLPILK